MPGQAVSGQPIRSPLLSIEGARPAIVRSATVWQRWRSLHSDILRHLRACDRLGTCVTIDQLAEELDEALGLVERRVEELCDLQLIDCDRERHVSIDPGSQQRCG